MRFYNDFRTPIEESKRPPVDILVRGHKNIYHYCLDLRGKAPNISINNLVLRPLYLALDNRAGFDCHWLSGPGFSYEGAVIYGVCPNSDAGATPWVRFEVSVSIDVYMFEYAPRFCFSNRRIAYSDMTDTDDEVARLLYTLAGLRKQCATPGHCLCRLDNYLQDKTEKYFCRSGLSDMSTEGKNKFAEYIVHNITSKDACASAIELLSAFADKIDRKDFNQEKENTNA